MSEGQISRRLPPPEAWKQPDKWMDLTTGLALPNAPRLLLDTDDRGFVIPDRAMEMVLDMLFWSDYEWEYDPNDSELMFDDHHFEHSKYKFSAEANGGNRTAEIFRENTTLIGRMPRPLHNVFHDYTVDPDVPDIDSMDEYNKSYRLAKSIFKRLQDAAKNTIEAQQLFEQRRRTVALGSVGLKKEMDETGEAFMREFFNKHFKAYASAVESLKLLDQNDLSFPTFPELARAKPHQVVRKIGGLVSRKSINYAPMLLVKAA